MNDFNYLADFYDEFVGADYKKIASFISKWIDSVFPSAEIGVDLGCGSGTLTYMLADKPLDMIGIDSSAAMLAKAALKRQDSRVLFLQQPLTQIDLYGTADVFVSTLDCVNYLADEKAVESFISGVSLFANPGALFIFDLNTQYKYQTILNGQNFVYEDEQAFVVWENEFDGKNMFYDLTFFYRSGDLYRREEEHQQQVYYPLDFILSLLKRYGFEVLQISDDYTDKAVGGQTQRIVIVSKKERK